MDSGGANERFFGHHALAAKREVAWSKKILSAGESIFPVVLQRFQNEE
jgi:hypothetical protein